MKTDATNYKEVENVFADSEIEWEYKYEEEYLLKYINILAREYWDTPSRRLENIPLNFNALVKEWTEDVELVSSYEEMITHPAYQGIIALGKEAVPLLLRELKYRPHYWFSALRAITDENPVPEEKRGDLDAMASAWLEWGHKNGFL